MLMNISTVTNDFGTSSYAFYVEGNTNDVQDAENNPIQFSLFPNPAKDVLHLNFQNMTVFITFLELLQQITFSIRTMNLSAQFSQKII